MEEPKESDHERTLRMERVIPDPASQPAKKIPSLIVLKGKDRGKIFKMTAKNTSLGRDPNIDICLSDHSISRKHCLLINDQSAITIVDLQSSNGTLVNGKSISKAKLKDGDQIAIGETVMNFQMADALESEYLETVYKEITIDDLSSLYNCKYFLRELEQMRLSIPKSLPFSLLFLDLDFFKQVNDTHGHLTGSHILSEIGRLLLSNLKSSDIPSRYGGEEFAILLKNAQLEQAVLVAERIRQRVQQTEFFSLAGKPIHITVSIGITEAQAGLASGADLIHQSDEAMYFAKKQGRNQSAVYRPGPPPFCYCH
jgi:two-component system cell cycle response regulator